MGPRFESLHCCLTLQEIVRPEGPVAFVAMTEAPLSEGGHSQGGGLTNRKLMGNFVKGEQRSVRVEALRLVKQLLDG